MPAPRLTFPRTMRLNRGRHFMAVYESRARVNTGPLLVHALPNDLPYSRLGLAISRRIGKAVTRNAIKRRLREAFRLMQHDWPRGYDVVISVRAHEPMKLASYQQALAQAMRSLHNIWLSKSTPTPPTRPRTDTPARSREPRKPPRSRGG